ncbi:MtrB/PioB family decaheme-associated outer membrane protein [Shewanella sp. YIC-542]|uniref:MtrB/PioB family decaheme-associated outer membrane protein n=1 Tax=Shewanella mytili TaxID=3377111 RepID=UPI00398E6DA2
MMSFKMNLITLALLTVSGAAVSADFSVGKANTSSVNLQQYQCNRCLGNAKGYQGQVSVAAGYQDASDIHAANSFGQAGNGAIGMIDAQLQYRDAGYRGYLQAHQLGTDNAFLRVAAKESGLYQLALEYQNATRYRAGDVASALWHNQGTLMPATSVNRFDLSQEREKLALSMDFTRYDYRAFARYTQEDKTGHRAGSIVTPSPINIGLPVDATTQYWNAGVDVNGRRWNSTLQYVGSRYDNHIQHLSLPYLENVYAAAPDNQAHQLSWSGLYRLDNTILNGSVMAGRMIQDDALIQMTGNPLQNWDGQVDTLDGRLAMNTMLTPRLRLRARWEYSDRDNKSSVAEFAQYNFNSLTGAFRQNVPRDYRRNRYNIDARYRIASGYRLLAGYQRNAVQRSFSDREDTHDDNLWLALNARIFDTLSFRIKAEHANRGGSRYEANALTSSQQNALLRKYYLADRTRNGVALSIMHTPFNWLSVDVNTRYANDEYSKTQIGLTDVKDYGYDLNVGLQLTDRVHAYGFAGQQWIMSNQAGSQAVASADWFADTEDRFINLGSGLSYGGLLQNKLTLGLDYLFSNASSDTYLSGISSASYGDYYSYNHSASLYGDYALNAQMSLKLSYRYERYYDTDDAITDVGRIPGVVSLGDINHNYNAHQVMLSFSYQLR